jgi:hypothetical protein
LIHNGKYSFSPPFPVFSLAVSLIQPPFRSFPMTEICRSTLLPARFVAAALVAVLLTAIAARADAKQPATFSPTANSLTENNFSRVSHSHPKARLDKRLSSCQLIVGF